MSMTLAELERRYNSGEKQRKDVQKSIDLQLSRFCAYRDCDKSLAFTRKGAYCSSSHSDKEAYCIRKEKKLANKLKKERYNERHGIVRKKIIKRKINKTVGLDYKNVELMYENYKEPLRPLPKSVGYGFMGTIATTKDHNYIQCHVCGKLFSHLGAHVTQHRLNAKEYKTKFQLMESTALVGDEIRKNMQARVINGKIKKGMPLPEHLKEYNRKVQSGEIKHGGHNSWTLERRNKEGLCPDQVLEKIKELAEKMGKTPSLDEFEKHFHGRYLSAIIYQHKSWTNAVKKAKLVTRDEMRKPDRDKLIQELQEFQKKYKRIPMTSDFNRGYLRDRGVFIRVFGTLNNARIEAGMNAVIPMPFGQIVELTPEQYMQYQNGHRSPNAIRSKRKREKAKMKKKLQVIYD